ncbi:MAG: BrnT family toxin [Defluviitaleaceae bacterium]|nr:BrnT family toxin [Defluviitaleaceae bacterium]
MRFEWDEDKNKTNIAKHGISFEESTLAFFDENRILADDTKHSTPKETRYFMYGNTGKGIATVRFVLRDGNVRIIGAGYWREGKIKYDNR